MPYLMLIVLLVILLSAVVYDYRYHRIPNVISLSGWIIGPVLFAVSDELPAMSASLYGFIFIFSLTLPLYLLAWMGAGDVKLMASVGAMVGIEYAPEVFLGIVITGAGMAVVMFVNNKLFKNSFNRYGAMLGLSLSLKKVIYIPPSAQEQSIEMPYALPIAVGTFLSLAII